MKHKRIAAVLFSGALLLGLLGCQNKETPYVPAPTKEDKPILQTTQPTEAVQPKQTPVYATAFGDTIYLASIPLEQLENRAPECDTREVSLGGHVHCGQMHKSETEITRVVILEDLYPQSTADWFRGMSTLVSIQGLEKLHTDFVTDMSFMFSGCTLLSVLEADLWDVSKVENMTGIFDFCDALKVKPVWYQEPEGGLQDKLEEEDTFNGGAIH